MEARELSNRIPSCTFPIPVQLVNPQAGHFTPSSEPRRVMPKSPAAPYSPVQLPARSGPVSSFPAGSETRSGHQNLLRAPRKTCQRSRVVERAHRGTGWVRRARRPQTKPHQIPVPFRAAVRRRGREGRSGAGGGTGRNRGSGGGERGG